MKTRYSFIIPIYNEEATLPELGRQIKQLLTRLDGKAEVLLIDDGSRDRSFAEMLKLRQEDERFKIFQLARNFGHQIAITAGMDYAQGDATIIMDADLQDPPEVVLEMIAKWKQGFEVVYAVREERLGDSWFKKITAALFYKLMNKMTSIPMPAEAGDFRLVDRRALDAFLKLREHHRYVRGLFSWIGFRQAGVTFKRNPRFAGETKYPLRKMMGLALDAIISFSHKPLRLALALGLIISAFSFLVGVWALVAKLFGFYVIRGWTSLMVLISFVGGAQLIVIGILGEYLARIYEEVKARPLYLIREMHVEKLTTSVEIDPFKASSLESPNYVPPRHN